ncbi:MAG: hypothetical protein JWN70_6383 [Planctomycetaceae bacterium]|nr:hypothetical protein [Planctomycetaceae bacterium]
MDLPYALGAATMTKTQTNVIIGLLAVIAACLVFFVARTPRRPPTVNGTPGAEVVASIPDEPTSTEKWLKADLAEQIAGFQAKIDKYRQEIIDAKEELKTATDSEVRDDLKRAIESANRRIGMNQQYIDALQGKRH